MPSEPPSRTATHTKHKSLFERLSAFVFREPDNRTELRALLQVAQQRGVVDADALSMIEGVLKVAELRAADLMVPRSQMQVVDLHAAAATWLARAIETAHSRLPVIDGSLDRVVGILLAKDLLRCLQEPRVDPRSLLRPALFVPETKPVNELLREFRGSRNHMAIVIDEYGAVAGLITIEDILEQIVGDIIDEYDGDDRAQGIVPEADGRYRVSALTSIAALNAALGTELANATATTVGGLLAEHLGRVPRRGDIAEIDGLRFEVLRADARQVHLVRVGWLHPPAAADFRAGLLLRHHA
ncbi:MAG: transporter associated domain-containing protein [Sutterellaceae bacterium]|nr:CBS domain-containing protein [Burkholderiaceae bacterium]MDW8429171.1 transporter associated domain-containing protein [Sutterellaceae bacterium]